MKVTKYLSNTNILMTAVIIAVTALAFGGAYVFSRTRGHLVSPTQGSLANKCPADACIKLLGKTADPDTITVTTGSYVQFNSADGGKHNIALEHSGAQHDDPSQYESGDFNKDEAWKVQIKQDGAYTFRDKYNPDLEVNIVAYTKGKDYKIK